MSRIYVWRDCVPYNGMVDSYSPLSAGVQIAENTLSGHISVTTTGCLREAASEKLPQRSTSSPFNLVKLNTSKLFLYQETGSRIVFNPMSKSKC